MLRGGHGGRGAIDLAIRRVGQLRSLRSLRRSTRRSDNGKASSVQRLLDRRYKGRRKCHHHDTHYLRPSGAESSSAQSATTGSAALHPWLLASAPFGAAQDADSFYISPFEWPSSYHRFCRLLLILRGGASLLLGRAGWPIALAMGTRMVVESSFDSRPHC